MGVAEQRVVGGMATIPNRKEHLRIAVGSLEGQLDRLYVHANYPEDEPLPECLDRSWITVSRGPPDRGDVGKFVGLWAEPDRSACHYFTFDDDIEYPRDYVERTMAGLQRYGGRAVVSYHGGTLPERVTSFYKERDTFYFGGDVAEDTAVNIVGTGVSAFKADVMPLEPEDFETTRAADLHLARKAQAHAVPMVVLAHDGSWIRDIGSQPTSLWGQESADDTFKKQNTQIAQRTQWTVHAARVVE